MEGPQYRIIVSYHSKPTPEGIHDLGLVDVSVRIFVLIGRSVCAVILRTSQNIGIPEAILLQATLSIIAYFSKHKNGIRCSLTKLESISVQIHVLDRSRTHGGPGARFKMRLQ